MKLLRNPEVKHYLMLYAIITLAGTVTGFRINVKTGILILSLCLVFTLVYLINAYKRYHAMAGLISEVDAILHGKETIHLSQYTEGELSLLQSELMKLTVRLREQAEMLQRDKIKLADSMADISHQIRTPLTAMNLILSILTGDEVTEEKRKNYLKELNRLMARIDWLIQALLKISKLDAGTVSFQREQVEFSKLVQRAVSLLVIPMEVMEQELVLDVSGSFTGDLSWTVEAVGNIMKNCIEHMDVGGKLYVTASENAVYSELIIRDTGKGIEKEDLPHLFERFYKGKHAGEQSVGIGLALARTILNHQNGTIRAENHRSGGAVFTIRFYKGTV